MTSTGGVQTIDTFDVWCREHKRFEPLKLTSQLLMQLASGLLDFDEWAHIMTHLQEGLQRRVDTSTGSHGCGAGIKAAKEDSAACHSLFCMIWEPLADNSFGDFIMPSSSTSPTQIEAAAKVLHEMASVSLLVSGAEFLGRLHE